MTGTLSTFAQKLNVASPKSFHSRTSRKASLLVVARTGGELSRLLELIYLITQLTGCRS